MAKIQQLTFSKGLTNIPSDAVCDDGSLEESFNVIYDNGEYRPIQKPFEMGTIDGELMAVHKTRAQDNYIMLCHVGENTNHPYYAVCYSTYNGVFSDPKVIMSYEPNGSKPNVDIAFVGNTVVFNTKEQYVNGGLQYYLWRPDSGYKFLGNKIPFPQIEFYTYDAIFENRVTSTADAEGILTADDSRWKINTEKNRENYNNLVVGLYEKNKNKIAKDNAFCEPFFVRYAVELYDGTYTNISSPQLIMPNINLNSIASISPLGLLTIATYFQYLAFRANYDFSEWSDIIKGISVFVTDGAPLYDTSSDQPLVHGVGPNIKQICQRKYREKEDSDDDLHTSYVVLKNLSTSSILDEIKDLSVFYKISELGLSYTNVMIWVPIKKGTIENLTTQTQLTDDYYSRCSLSAVDMVSYNQRIILSGVKRGFFVGDLSFVSWDNQNTYEYTMCVYIDTPEGQRVVTNRYSTKEKVGQFFFYPDPRAKKAEAYVHKDGKTYQYKSMELKEHPFLNGSYFIDLPYKDNEPVFSEIGTVPTENTKEENLHNQLWVSETNNPFVFTAEGNVTVGNGNIITISSITQALSQGQFGQYPLIVFSSDGIWACSTSSTGLFSSVHPMSREVCNSRQSVTQTDGNIFFSSEKGLMVINGSNVSCVSDQLDGKSEHPFQKFLKSAKLAYDYRDSLLWIVNGEGYGYVYSIKHGTFSNVDLGPCLGLDVVNNYPDTIISLRNSVGRSIEPRTVFSLLNRPNINDDTNRYSGTMVSRPLKLENALALKVINEIKHISVMDGVIAFSVYASNDLRQWYKISSTHGKPWKYYKFSYNFSSMKATDRFSGTVVETEERHTDRLR